VTSIAQRSDIVLRILFFSLIVSTTLAVPAFGATTKVDGLNVHFTVHGSGPTIMFIHGWTCDESSWAYQVPAFSKDYRAVTLDLPGHGKSSSPAEKDFSMDLFANAVEAVRQAVHADRIVLVGHSMGVVVIRQYALEHPEHVAGLVGADGPLDIRSFASRPGGQPPLTLEQRGKMIDGMFVPQTPESLRTKIKTMMLATPATTASGASAAMFDTRIQSTQIITVPALTIYAGTALFPQSQSTKEMLPNWEGTQIAGTGHFVMMEKPEEFNRLLRAFLTDRVQFH
jgi:pimeloyl-ACP methyl ester carboxylesterase